MFISVYTKPSARETNGRTAEGQVLAGYFVMQRAWGERQQLYLAQAGVYGMLLSFPHLAERLA